MRLFVLAALFCCLSPCASAATPVPPKITQVIADSNSITLTFDQPMLTWNEAANFSAVRIEPDIACQWSWSDDTSLRCATQDHQPLFHMATAYRLAVGHGLWSQAGVELLSREATAETQRPELGAQILSWTTGVPKIRLTTPQKLTPEAIAQVVSVDLDGRALRFQVVALADTKNARRDDQGLAFELQLLDLPGHQGMLRVRVRPGLQGAEGPLPGKQDKHVLVALVNEPFRLREASCVTGYSSKRVPLVPRTALAIHCGPDTPIGLYFSRKPSAAAIAAIKASLPAGLALLDPKDAQDYWNYNYQPGITYEHAPDAALYLKASAAATTLRVALPGDLMAEDGARLSAPAMLALVIDDYPRSIAVKPDVLVAAVGSSTLPVMEARNVSSGPRLVRMSIGEKEQMQASQLPGSGARNQLRHVQLPKTADAIREHGGLVLVGAQDDRDLAYAIAYAPFNVLVSEGGGQLLVWASSWGDSRNLAGATVELLSIDSAGRERQLGKSVTGTDGVTLLDVPADARKQSGVMQRLVRVTQGGQRTIVPVMDYNDRVSSLLHYDSEHRSYSRFSDSATRSFGVSDRPLYRPGETVSYRVWLRQRKGNRLLGTGKDKVTLTLRSEDRKTLQSWPATLDGQGSVSGQLHLPALMPDNNYCISARDSAEDPDRYSDPMQGACFQIARFEAQSLWAEVKADRTTVLAGKDIGLQLEGGYFSGDAAANVAVHFSAVLTPKRLEDAYPEFAAYTFIDPFTDAASRGASDPLLGMTTPTLTDRDGKAHFTLHLPAATQADGSTTSLPFGVLQFNASISIPGKASATSAPAVVNDAQFARYVGLKAAQWWLPIDRDPQLEAVVISHDGHAVAGQAVQVSIEAGDDDAATGKPKVVGHCELIAGQASPCAFRAPTTGSYRFRATAEGAAPTALTRYIGAAAPVDPKKPGEQASLSLLHASSDGVASARVKLHQPYAKANVLFTLEYGHVVSHWVQAVSGKDSEIDVPVQAAWAPGVTLHALIRASDPASAPDGPAAHTLDATLDLEIPKQRGDAIAMSLDRPRAAPGDDIVLRLVNTTTSARHATIALVDDSVYQQAGEMNAYADPTGDGWLGSLKSWDRSIWYGLEGWSTFANPFYVEPSLHHGRGILNGPPPPVINTPSPMAAPGLAASMNVNLDRVEVLGSRIKRRAVDTEPTQPVTTLTRADVAQTRLTSTFDVINHIAVNDGSGLSAVRSRPTSSGKPMPRMRSAFADSAYWNPDVALAPGETRELKIHLPDNLTRWRVLVWASDDTDGFGLTQTTLETALPIELRAGVPGQLYVGDQATASVSARNHGGKKATIDLGVQAEGAGVRLQQSRQGTVDGNAELSQRIAFAPTEVGDVQVLARAGKTGAGDGLSSGVAVLSRMGDELTTQTGWIDADALNLALPSLPAGASSPVLDVQVHRGFDSWRDGWLRDLRDYPHRCWEQTLSRAVGAALAIASGQDKSLWPNAQSEVSDALVVAPAFQAEDGSFRYFIAQSDTGNGSGNEALSAYTLRSFGLLHTLGFEPPKNTQEDLERAVKSGLSELGRRIPDNDYDSRWETAAQAAGALTDPGSLDNVALDRLWQNWAHLSWYGRSELVRALTRKPKFAEQAKTGILRLREAGIQKGLRRVLHDDRDFSWSMGSDLRDQCGVVAALFDLDKGSDGEQARRGLLRGLQDLYSGGTASLDTQSSAQCLMALHAVAKSMPADDRERSVLLSLGAASHATTLAPHQDQAEWSQKLAVPTTGTTNTLRLQTTDSFDATLNYSAELRYQLDLQQAKPHAVGMRLERSYQVLRNGAWVELAKTSLHEGDWVRVRLVLDVPAFRHFVAITDIVPGGLVSRDISLSSVGGADLKHVGGLGSWWFGSRQTGQNDVKIYAEQLPPGIHEVFYYAQAVQPGDYFAPPAVAELMYGRASRSTTAPARIVIVPASPAAKH